MKKNNRLLMILIFVTIFLTMFTFNNSKATNGIFKNKHKTHNGKKLIMIDPGHGGVDGGAVSKNNVSEKNINLAISLKLKDELKAKGYDVILTREEDKELCDNGTIRHKKLEDLKNRCKLKESSGCDMFLSIHLNKFPEEKYYGAQVWYSKFEESRRLAHIVQEDLKSNLQNGNKRVEKSAGDSYKLLRCHDVIPSVIVECGFLSNGNEEKLLITDEYQGKIAKSISESIDKFYKQKSTM